ncbi:MAG: hypothetical protein KJO53_09980 [Eudoraea sp.]|nr:hypothetical protein [Eudoraea sp.]NNL03507.1 hypothetical protein [Eudoraea sp.]
MSGLQDARQGLTALSIKDNPVMEKMMYLLSQYLSAAGISFLEKEPDDSHTNLGFSIEKSSMYSRPLSGKGDTLSVNYRKFVLEWNSNSSSDSLRLDGTTHAEVLRWIVKMSLKAEINQPYEYSFHYESPYAIKDNFIFQILDTKRLEELLALRVLSQTVLESFLEKYRLNSEIRIWPHHFDTGAYAIYDNMSNKAVGLGLAVPDTVCNEHYFYISGYHDQNIIDTSDYNPLSIGTWGAGEFKGAILPAKEVNKSAGLSFFSEAFSQYENNPHQL